MKKGLFVGLTTVDIQYFVEGDPVPNTKIKTEAPIVAAGGPAANAAVAFSYLGGEAHFISCVGENEFRQLILNDYTNQQIQLFDILEGKYYQPIVSTVITNLSNSDRTIITHHPEKLSLEPELDNIKPEAYDFIFTDGFYPEIAVPLCKAAKKKGVPVIFDGGSWKPQLPEIIPLVDVAICSNNYMPPGCRSKEEAIAYTHQMGVELVAISRGSESIVTQNQAIEVPRVDAVDSLGAGDILHGAFCWYWNKHANEFVPALKSASRVASETVKYKGTRSWMKK